MARWRVTACSLPLHSDPRLAYYTDRWDYEVLIPGSERLKGEVRGVHAGVANYLIQQRHPEVRFITGASYTVGRRRKNAAGRFIVWLLQFVSTGNRFDSGCDGRGNPSSDSGDVIVVEDVTPSDALSGVDLDSLHGVLNSSTNVDVDASPPLNTPKL
jgi:hypothetical protein